MNRLSETLTIIGCTIGALLMLFGIFIVLAGDMNVLVTGLIVECSGLAVIFLTLETR